MSCPEPSALQSYIEGVASAEQQASMRTHLEDCAVCREVVLALAADTPVDALSPTQLDRPTQGRRDERQRQLVGRYMILDRLGEGGMGVVYAAYDSELDRKVALKVIRRVVGENAIEELQARLVREAQAMARIAHPNVTAVYDVGRHGDEVFIAMELIVGETLGEWLRRAPRTPREVAEVFLHAGRGWRRRTTPVWSTATSSPTM